MAADIITTVFNFLAILANYWPSMMLVLYLSFSFYILLKLYGVSLLQPFKRRPQYEFKWEPSYQYYEIPYYTHAKNYLNLYYKVFSTNYVTQLSEIRLHFLQCLLAEENLSLSQSLRYYQERKWHQRLYEKIKTYPHLNLFLKDHIEWLRTYYPEVFNPNGSSSAYHYLKVTTKNPHPFMQLFEEFHSVLGLPPINKQEWEQIPQDLKAIEHIEKLQRRDKIMTYLTSGFGITVAIIFFAVFVYIALKIAYAVTILLLMVFAVLFFIATADLFIRSIVRWQYRRKLQKMRALEQKIEKFGDIK